MMIVKLHFWKILSLMDKLILVNSCILFIYNSVGKPYWSEAAVYHSLAASSSLL